MFTIFAILQVVISLLLISVVLLQEGKKGMGAIFGGSSGSVFGARGAANILTKVTTVLAALFMLNSVWLAHLSSDSSSVTDAVQQEVKVEPKKAEPKKAVEKKAEGEKPEGNK